MMKPRDTLICAFLSAVIAFSLGQQTREPLLDKDVTIVLTSYTAGNLFKERYTFEPARDVTINITNISSTISFMVLQVHAYERSVMLSYDKNNLNDVSNKSILGSNVGLFVDVNASETVQMFARNNNTEKVEALVVITLYDNKAPIPGGCNMEFEVKYAPYQKLTLGNAMITVDFQPASVPSATNQFSCENDLVQYDVYQMYLSNQDFSIESYFQGISSMINVQDIIHNGNKISNSALLSTMRHIYNSYRGTGVVFAVIASYNDSSAAYVPTFTYSCSPVSNPGSCKYLSGSLEETDCAIILIVSLLAIFFGHRHFRVELSLHLYLTGALIGYIIVTAAADYETLTNVRVAMVTGLVMIPLVWLSINYFLPSKSYRRIIPSITFGPLMGCIIYYYFSASLVNDWTFYLLTIAIIILTYLASSKVYYMCTIAASICTSYAFVVSIDYFAGSSLKYIVINTIRRLTVSGFNVAIIQPPCGPTEITLAVFWPLLAIFRTWRHYKRKEAMKRRNYDSIPPQW